MAARYFTISAAGAAAETPNTTATLLAAIGTANAVAGAKADITTELAAAVANIPTGAMVIALDTSLVTTLNKLRQLLDAAYNNIAASSLLPKA